MSTSKPKKVIVGMSGGVDSSVVAALLKDQGYEVVGVFMHFWHDVADKLEAIDIHIENKCCSREAEENARKVAQKLGIKFYSVNVSKEFKKAVVDYFLRKYNSGRTPNPCVECNRSIKFGVMLDKALAMGADYIATGHYVRLQGCHFDRSERGTSKRSGEICKREILISNKDNIKHTFYLLTDPSAPIVARDDKFKLLKAKDKNKDQGYFLYTLTQNKLKHCLFPIGDYTKTEVREIAKKYGLEIHDKKESQEICFIQGKYYGDFLRKYLKLIPGEIVSCNNIKAPQSEARLRQSGARQDKSKKNILGKHKGLPLYTIGQRRDIGIGGTGPYYVVGMNYKKNSLIVSNNKNDKNLFSKKLIAEKVNWISGKVPKLPLKIKAKIRYRMDECSAVIKKKSGKYIIEFFKPQRAAMPGQSVVFYSKNEIIGGGIIKNTG